VAPILTALILAGLLGSGHCLLMCGGFFGACAGKGTGRVAIWAMLAGRLVAYTAMGGVAGSVGEGLDQLLRLDAAAPVSTLLAAVGLVVMGLLQFWQPAPGPASGPAATVRLGARPLAAALRMQGPAASLVLGAALALLPCAMLHAALLSAAGTGSIPMGALAMASFALGGSLPLGLLGGGLRQVVSRLLGQRPIWVAVLTVALGSMTLVARLSPAAMAHHHHIPAGTSGSLP
jgi:sulfite exporter TauE/SafE